MELKTKDTAANWHFRDNGSPTPAVIADIYALCNLGLEGGLGVYGVDPITEKASNIMRTKFGPNAEVYITASGTVANIIGTLLLPKAAHVICSACSHLIWLENDAPRKAGVTLYPARSDQGKISVELIDEVRRRNADLINIVQITQCTEYGTFYSMEELKEIGAYCNENKLLFGVDGARLCYAALASNTTLNQQICETGVDYFATGVAKIGGLMGNMLIVVDREKTAQKEIMLKDQGSIFNMIKERATPSNLWSLSGQFVTLFEKDTWTQYVSIALQRAAQCGDILLSAGFRPAFPVQTNALFIRASEEAQERLAAKGWSFFCWPSESELIRFMFAFNTPEHLPELLAKDILELRAQGYL